MGLGLLLANQATGNILGSAHDFATQGFTGRQTCVVCHTPHSPDANYIQAPLWNHKSAQESFALYSSGATTISGQPNGVSKLCLSCHDGTVAIDSFGGATGDSFISGPTNSGMQGAFNDDHPISINFDAALATSNAALHDPTTRTVTIGSGSEKPRSGTVATLMLSNGSVQCSSCHDVHNNFAVPGDNGRPLLKVSKAGSSICFTCHNK